MKYENPNMSVILLEDENIVTTSSTGPLVPGVDIGDETIDGDD